MRTKVMIDHAIGGAVRLEHAPPEIFYRGISPQILARTMQLWASQGLDFEKYWRMSLGDIPGMAPLPLTDETFRDSAQPDLVFLFDQGLIWAKALHAVATAGLQNNTTGLDPAQWQGLASVSARLNEQLIALRMLSLSHLPTPAMQIARSVSEDTDMALVLIIRRKLAQRFVGCRTVDDANDFWRRHIAGGRAFRAISEKLYTVGIDYSSDTEYAKWRRGVLTTLGAAVHSNALISSAHPGQNLERLFSSDSLFFAAFRLHEFCAYSQLVRPELMHIFDKAAFSSRDADRDLARIASKLSFILVNQIQCLTRHDRTLGETAPTRH